MSIPISYKDGYDLALNNSRTLLNIANKSYSEGAIGIACSLNILAVEEALKASFLIIKHYYPNGQLNEFDNIFRLHKIKHDQLKQFAEFQKSMRLQIAEFVKKMKPKISLLKANLNRKSKKEKAEILDLEKRVNLFKKHSELDFDLPGILSWLENANTDKNRGFYVDKQKKIGCHRKI